MKSAKAHYKQALRHKDRGDFKVVSNDLHDCLLNKDQPSFWKTKFTHKSCNPDIIDGCNEPAFIANKFATIFEIACAPNNPANDRLQTYSDFSVESVDRCLGDMKLHKAAGFDGIETEHLLYSHPVTSVLLCRLFSSMLRCGCVPNDFHMRIIIPVIKDVNADVSASNN
jgi:hypothetical protein